MKNETRKFWIREAHWDWEEAEAKNLIEACREAEAKQMFQMTRIGVGVETEEAEIEELMFKPHLDNIDASAVGDWTPRSEIPESFRGEIEYTTEYFREGGN